MTIPIVLSLAVLSYLLGSCPNGLLIARAKGIDIRSVGSGNIGATNVLRNVGKGAGILAFLLDAAKGWVPAAVFPGLAARWANGALPDPTVLGLVFGIAAIVGHNWPVFLRFKGGKGVATSAGVLIGVAPYAAMIGLAVFVVTAATTGYASLGSICSASAVAVAGWMLYRNAGLFLPIALTVLAAMVVWRHRTNIRRLLDGTENRFGKRKEKSEFET